MRAILVLALALTGCRPGSTPVPNLDAGITQVEAGAATCLQWCAHATSLGCDAAKPSPAGASCNDVCENAQAGLLKWNLTCRANAASCDAADNCEN